MYDKKSNRFIFVVLHGSTAATSEVLIAFSKKQDPRDGWWVYRLKGDPKGKGRWFDYPSIGVAGDDFYLTGNLFNDSDRFQGSIVYQINKPNAFTGGTINWRYWYDVNAPSGADCNAFTLVPMTYGQEGWYGPGVYMVSSCSGGGDQIYLWDVTKNFSDNPSLKSYVIETGDYSIAGDARQKGSSDRLDTGGCRVRDGFYMNGYIHFVFTTDYQDLGYSRIRYNRLNVNTREISYRNYGLKGYDYCYPAIASASGSSSDKSVIIGFVRSGSSIYPQARAFAYGNSFSDYSGSKSSKLGETYVSNSSSSSERWGDYTGIVRDFSSSAPAVWTAGHYAVRENSREPNVYNTYISKFNIETTGSLTGNDPTAKNLATTSVQPIAEASLDVFPNPVQSLFTLRLNMTAKTSIHAYIIDQEGKLVRTLYKGKASKGTNELTFNKEALTNGVYTLLVQDVNNNEIYNEKITIID